MTDEQKFISKALCEAIEICGEMMAEINECIGTPALSMAATVTQGILAGYRVKLTFEIVTEDCDEC